MNIVVVLAHPQPGSFNHAIAHTAADQLLANGHGVVMHDLYQEGFDPVLTGSEIAREALLPSVIADHCAEIACADGIVIFHPNWWGMPPAILKGWVDRIVRPGIAYSFVEGDSGDGVPVGLLKARAAVVFNTSNTETERERTVFGYPLETIWKNCIFGLCGVKCFHRQTFGVVVTSNETQRTAWLAEAAAIVDRFFPAEGEGRVR